VSWRRLVVLALLWWALAGSLHPMHLLVGIAVGAAALAWAGSGAPVPKARRARLSAWRRLAWQSAVELGRSSVEVAGYIVRPRSRFRPGIVEIPLRIRDQRAITLLAALITLMPGSIAIAVSRDRRFLYGHFIHVPSARAIQHAVRTRFEDAIVEIFS
jgi:multicomponent Na+:H+ antiporter subunit E